MDEGPLQGDVLTRQRDGLGLSSADEYREELIARLEDHRGRPHPLLVHGYSDVLYTRRVGHSVIVGLDGESYSGAER